MTTHAQSSGRMESTTRRSLLAGSVAVASAAGVGLAMPSAKADTGAECGCVDTHVAIASQTLASSVTHLRTAGYAAVGDGGDALYRRVSSEPAHEGKAQSLDGAWWEIVYSGELRPQQFGAVGDNATDSTDAFQNLFDFLTTLGAGVYGAATVHVPAGRYRVGPITIAARSCRVVGDGSLATRIAARSAGQSHVLHFTSPSGSTEIRSLEVLGWTSTTEPQSFADVGMRFDGAGPAIEDFRVSRCKTCIWITKGNAVDIRNGAIATYTGVGLHIGGVADSPISETRVDTVDIFSGATTITGDANAYGGVGIKLDTDCRATVLENISMGSNIIAIEVVDGLGLGNERAPGHVNARRVNTGRNRDAGVWIKNNGGSFSAVASRFSADGSPEGDGLRVSSPNAGVLLYECGWHWCRRSGVRISAGNGVAVNGGTFRELGVPSGTPGVGVDIVDGAASVTVQGANFESNLTESTHGRVLGSAVRLRSGYSGVTDVVGCRVVDATTTALRNDSGSAVLNSTANLIR